MEFYAIDAPLHGCLVLLRWLVCGQMGAQTPRTARQVLVNAVTGKVEYWEQSYRFADLPGVEKLLLRSRTTRD
jgi:hypothetical protein